MHRQAMVILAVVFTTRLLAAAEPIEVVGRVALDGDLSHPGELSGAALVGELLVVCPDEGATLNVLRRTSDERFDALPGIELLQNDAEIDMEGVAFDGRSIYVIGAHCRARRKVEPDKKYETNRKRLTEIKDEDSRRRLIRLRLDDQGRLVSKDSLSLRKLIRDDELLGRFARLPSKENGVDIEGIAAADGKLFVGFRGPVLRGNYVPVMVFDYEEPREYELRFVELGGRGIRDLAAVDAGILVLAGPVGDGDGSSELYFWDMRDCLPGEGSPAGKIAPLGTIRAARGEKPEGIAVTRQSAGEVTLLVVRDGAAQAAAELVRVALPR